MKKTIMAIFTHADDIEFGCSGTLAKYIKAGYKGYYVLLTRSNSGYQHLKSTWENDKEKVHFMYSNEIAAIRKEEATKAAGELGAEPVFFDFKEIVYTTKEGDTIPPDIKTMDFGVNEPEGREPIEVATIMEERIKELEDFLVEKEPEIVITWDHFNENPDHYCTFIMTYKAFIRAAWRADLGTLYATASQFPPQYSPYFARKADWFVNISDPEVLDRCGKALSHMISQFPKGTKLHNHGWGAGRGGNAPFLGLGIERTEAFATVLRSSDVKELKIKV